MYNEPYHLVWPRAAALRRRRHHTAYVLLSRRLYIDLAQALVLAFMAEEGRLVRGLAPVGCQGNLGDGLDGQKT